MISKRTIFFIASIFLVQAGISQVSTKINASVSKNKVLLGEPFVLTIEARLPSVSGSNFIQIDTIPHFEFLAEAKIDSVVKDGEITITGVYKLTSFDSGHWEIPSFSLVKGVKTERIPIDVVFSDFDPGQDYHDIKDILEVKVAKKKFAWWIYAVGLVVLIILITFLTRKQNEPKVMASPKIAINPFEEAMNELSLLEKNIPASKEYYSRLVNIFRLYIFRKKGILSLQKTTDDLVIQLKSLHLDKEQFAKLSQSLQLSDFVKFAKYQSTEAEDKMTFETIKNTIKVLEQSE